MNEEELLLRRSLATTTMESRFTSIPRFRISFEMKARTENEEILFLL